MKRPQHLRAPFAFLPDWALLPVAQLIILLCAPIYALYGLWLGFVLWWEELREPF